jgi:predicted nucleotidyltransferase
MHPLIEQHREQIAALCKRYGVRRLDVFGSILREDFDPAGSDVDVVAEFASQAAEGGLRRYVDFKATMEALLKRSVDVIELDAMEDTRLKRIIERTRVPVYAAAA